MFVIEEADPKIVLRRKLAEVHELTESVEAMALENWDFVCQRVGLFRSYSELFRWTAENTRSPKEFRVVMRRLREAYLSQNRQGTPRRL